MGAKCLRFGGFIVTIAVASVFVLSSGLCALGLTACTHSQSPPAAAPAGQAAAPCSSPEPLRVSIHASQRLNPGEGGEALATVVRLYQLKGAGKLTGASFDELLDHDKDTLGDDFLNVQEVTINPGDNADPPMSRHADAAYVAAVALFRQPVGTSWRAIKKLAPADAQHCHATAERPDGSPPKLDDPARFFLDENRLELK
jgi:type VI secretion system protein VasD